MKNTLECGSNVTALKQVKGFFQTLLHFSQRQLIIGV